MDHIRNLQSLTSLYALNINNITSKNACVEYWIKPAFLGSVFTVSRHEKPSLSELDKERKGWLIKTYVQWCVTD